MTSLNISLQEKISYKFTAINNLEQALRHPSLDHKKKGYCGVSPYERLEFLGDRVLGLVIAEVLFEKYPNESEGLLAKRFSSLVRKEMLANIAGDVDLPDYIQTADGIVTKSMSADACEALIAAVYLDGGFSAAKTLVRKLWASYIERSEVTELQDAKSELQEYLQSQSKKLPLYKLIKKTGLDHDPHFLVEVSAADSYTESATAATKKQAEQLAADKLLKRLKNDT